MSFPEFNLPSSLSINLTPLALTQQPLSDQAIEEAFNIESPLLSTRANHSQQPAHKIHKAQVLHCLSTLQAQQVSSQNLFQSHMTALNREVEKFEQFQYQLTLSSPKASFNLENEWATSLPHNLTLPPPPQLSMPLNTLSNRSVVNLNQPTVEKDLGSTQDPFWLFKKEEVAQSMAVAELIGTAIETMDEVAEKAITAITSLPHFKPAVKEAALTAAIPNPLIRETVKILAPVAKNMIEVESTKFFQAHPHLQEKRKKAQEWTEHTVHKITEFIQKKPRALSHELHSQFNIPEEEALTFTSYTNKIVMHFALGAATKKITKALFGVSKISENTIKSSANTCILAPSFSMQATLESLDPISTRINRLFLNELRFPTAQEIEKISVSELHSIWRANHQTLVGFVDQNTIPKFGFHGTSIVGFEGIKLAKAPYLTERGPLLWVAGYRYSLDPITILADIHTLINKATDYLKKGELKEGGLFVINTNKAFSAHKPIMFKEINLISNHLPIDSSAEIYFQRLINRNSDQSFHTTLQQISSYNYFPINRLVNADELIVTFNPTTYQEVVKGSISSSKTLYSLEMFEKFEGRDLHKQLLAERFKSQEIITQSFEHLELIPSLQSAPWSRYQQIGQNIVANYEESAFISQSQLRALLIDFEKQNHANAQEILNSQNFSLSPSAKKWIEDLS